MGLQGRGRCPWVQYDQNTSSQPHHVGYHFNVILFTEFIGGIFKAEKIFYSFILCLVKYFCSQNSPLDVHEAMFQVV